MRPHTPIAACLLVLLTSVGYAQAQSFEGTLTQRSLTVEDDALYELMDEISDGAEFDTEEAYNRDMALRLFALPFEKLTAMASAGQADLNEFIVRVRGSRIRAEGQSGEPYSITDVESGTMWMVNPAEHSYVEFTKEAAEETRRKSEEMMARMGIDPSETADQDHGDEPGDAEVDPLGETRSLNGFEASGFRASSDGEIAEAWCATDRSGLRGVIEKLAEGQAEEEGPAMEDVMCADRMPVLTKSYHPYARIYEVSEVLAITRAPQSAELFEVPEGFRRIDPWR